MKSNMCKQNFTKAVVLAAVLAAVLAGGLAASAADIAWTDQYLTSAGTEVSTRGTLLEALNFGAAGLLTPTTTNNGVVFTAKTGANPTGIYFSSQANKVPADANDVYTGGLAVYNDLLSSFTYGASTNVNKVTLSGLTIGQAYQVQLFLGDDRNIAAVINRTVVMDWNTSNVYTSSVYGLSGNAGDGLVINGTFTANSTTQTFTINILNSDGITYSGIQLNGYQLRAVEEPISWSYEFLTATGTEVMAKWTLLEALNFTPPAYPVSPTINGVTFTAFTDSTDPAATYFSATSDSIVGGGSRYLNGFAVYAGLLARFIWDGDAADDTVTLSGLTVGRVYQVQLFMADENVNAAARTMIMDMGLVNEFTCPAYGTNNVDGYVINGTFTADATSKTFTMNNNGTAGIQLSGYQLRLRPLQGTVILVL